MQRYLNKTKANQVFRPTIGCDFHNYKTVIGGQNVTLQIWDTAGQERYQSLGKAFYRGSDWCILVYDITREESLHNLHQWIDTFSSHAGIGKISSGKSPKFPFYLVGNKWDLIEEKEVEDKHIDSFLDKNWMSPERAHLTSAETGTGVEEVSKLALFHSYSDNAAETY